MRVAILVTCYNRRQITMECFRRLFACRNEGGHILDVWLNDDGCTDGTATAVSLEYPDVRVIQGSGADYWCGGMRRVWEAAVNSGIRYDGFIWLNDDTWLYPDALSILLDDCRSVDSILVGAICSRDGIRATYGGENSHGFCIPNGSWQSLVQMNGNFVWVPYAVYEKIGILDRHWTHAMGDGDYSRTANEKGIKVLLTPTYVGSCDKNEKPPAWMREDVPFVHRVRNLYSPLGYSEPMKLLRYCLRHDGLFIAIKLLISQHIRVCFPCLWKGRGKK